MAGGVSSPEPQAGRAVPSAYSLAMDAARDTIVRRSRQYKWLVMGVSVVGVSGVLTAIVSVSLLPLTVVLALPAAVTGFFALDLRAVQRWRHAVLAAWVDGELQLDLLASTLKQVPTLPAQTVAGMLETLPAWPGEHVPLPARPALARLQDALARGAMQRLVALGFAMGAGAAALVAALIAGPPWLAGGLAVPLLWLAWDMAAQWRVRCSCRRALHDLLVQPLGAAPSDAAAAGWIACLDWQGLPRSLSAHWRSATPG